MKPMHAPGPWRPSIVLWGAFVALSTLTADVARAQMCSAPEPGACDASGHRAPASGAPRPQLDLDSMSRAIDSDAHRCAYASRLGEAQLRGLTVEFANQRARIVVRIVDGDRTTRGLERCLANAVRRAFGAGATVAGPEALRYPPFASLDLPMDPPPARPERPIAEGRIGPMLERLTTATDDDARLAAIAELEASATGLPVEVAARAVAAFTSRRVDGAAALCRLTFGRDVLRTLSASLDRPMQRELAARTRRHCGVETPPPFPPVPSDDARLRACSTNSDCALVCPVPPSCCPNCGCANAVNARYAASIHAQCEGRPRGPRECSPLACRRIDYDAACVEGRCVARRFEDSLR